MTYLLVTNDFPPKLGGIQSYLWELWRRLPPEATTVLTTSFPGDREWDARQAFRVERAEGRVLVPTPALGRRIDALADEVDAELVLLDPALPLGLVASRLRHPYGVVLHGAEVAVPGRLPGTRSALRRVLRSASVVVAAGGYPLREGERAAGRPLPAHNIPPGVDLDRFHPFDDAQRAAARRVLGLSDEAFVVAGVSRLVPRKGFDIVLQAASTLGAPGPDVVVVIAGAGRDRGRLEDLAVAGGVDARFLGPVTDDVLASVYGCADVFAMLCRSRWLGLEQEGFGIVFLEAAASGVAQVAGASGGSSEAVDDGVTGFVVAPPSDVRATARALERLRQDRGLRQNMGEAARQRASAFGYDALAARLRTALDSVAVAGNPAPTGAAGPPGGRTGPGAASPPASARALR
ncbi:MAG: glycosyltransferase family 4 protein [Acidimicrobiia bacterium]